MLVGEVPGCNTESLDLAAMTFRIWKIEIGLWASSKFRCSQFVTDEYLARFGFNL